jgi:hypothetical protein
VDSGVCGWQHSHLTARWRVSFTLAYRGTATVPTPIGSASSGWRLSRTRRRTLPMRPSSADVARIGHRGGRLARPCCLPRGLGGEGGIRTPDTVARMPHFECGAIDHSATSPTTDQRQRACVACAGSDRRTGRCAWGGIYHVATPRRAGTRPRFGRDAASRRRHDARQHAPPAFAEAGMNRALGDRVIGNHAIGCRSRCARCGASRPRLTGRRRNRRARGGPWSGRRRSLRLRPAMRSVYCLTARGLPESGPATWAVPRGLDTRNCCRQGP